MNTRRSALAALGLLIVLSWGVAPADAAVGFEGTTGLFTIPSPASVGAGRFSGGVFMDGYSIQRAESSRQTRTNFAAVYGVTRDFEVGFSKIMDSLNSASDPGLSVNAKYVFPDTKVVQSAVGLLLDTDNNHYSSGYILFGKDIAFFGMGASFGGHRGYPLNLAHFGGYDFDQHAPNAFFFLAGADFDLKIAHLTAEYDSDAFTLGFRVPTGDGWDVNVGYRSASDYDLLHQDVLGPTYDRTKVFLGVTGTY